MFKSFFLIFFLPILVNANEQWICTEASSQRQGNDILACGIGLGKTENDARLNAFDNAKTEFQRICSSSDDCKNHSITAEPKRTTCDADKNGKIKCYRMIDFTIGSKVSSSNNTQVQNLKDQPEKFEPFSYEQTLSYPKVSRGMLKKDLLDKFGIAESVNDVSGNGSGLEIIFKGKMCLRDDNYCSVYGEDSKECLNHTLCSVFVKNGKVIGWTKFKPVYTVDLK